MLETLERLLNRYVRESTAALDLLRALDGASFKVLIEGTRLGCVLRATRDGVALDARFDAPANATLRASPLDLLKLARAGGVRAIKGTRAELSGDFEVAERFGALLRLAQPDLEEELAKWIGDLAAHRVGRGAESARSWLARAAAALRMDVAEYLQEERRVLPAALEARAFYADVERLRDDVDRAAERLTQLERQRDAACGVRGSF
jgi:ubiquinone biosynthesis accessory factor UbiJ